MQEIISRYVDGEILLEYDENLTGCDEIRYSQGYINKITFASPFFYVNSDIPVIEIISYRKNSKNKESLVTLWDHNQKLFEFHCSNLKEEFDCVREFMEIASQIVEIEHKLKDIYEREE